MVLYHSSLNLEDRLRLEEALKIHRVELGDMSSRQQQDWRQLRGVADALLVEPRQLRLRDLLVTWHGQRAMGKWANFQVRRENFGNGGRFVSGSLMCTGS